MPSESAVWKDLKPSGQKGMKMSGHGADRRYYEWDHTHGDIEVYDSRGRHVGSMDATTGQMTKPPVKGRYIDL